jgi:NSS family neurotransmitter:Na+ symporter
VERAATFLIPALLVALVGMMIYGMFTADFLGAISFMLEPDFSKLTLKTVMIANGQAFFSVGIGLAAMVTFGAYLPDDVSIPRSAVIIILADTGVAVLAGLVIFPLVFAYGLSPSGGPGLVFQTLPLAFGQMPGGLLFGSLFFLLLIFAALSSCVGGIEAIVSWVERHRNVSRGRSVVYVAGTVWFIGLLTILSFGPLSDLRPLGVIPAFADKSIFDALDFLAANILLLVGGTLTAVFFGWLAPRALALEALGIEDGPLFRVLRFALRYVVPPVLVLSLLAGLAQ